MRRRAAIAWHAALSLAAGFLYFGFVLPRWWELTGETSHGLGTVARIAAGILVALAALPVVFTLLETRKPEFGTPALALTLRTSSVVTHVVAGVLIVGTAISEIWLSLDSVGQWLFGIYGAAAAIALLGIAGFYLSFVAESPPPPPKPLKPKKEKKARRGRGKPNVTEDTETADETDTAGETDAADESLDVEATADQTETTPEDTDQADESEDTDDTEQAEASGLRNRRPSGKVSHRHRRPRRGVAVDE